MKVTEISDTSMMDLGIMDFKQVTVFEDGAIILMHIDKFKDHDNSSVILLRTEEVEKLKEALNEKSPA